jgi:hypothetical protein
MIQDALVAQWHSVLRFDWRDLHVTDEGVHLIYLGKPNLWLALLGPIGKVLLLQMAKKAYERALAIPPEERVKSHPKNEFIPKARIVQIEGTPSGIRIINDRGTKCVLKRLDESDLMAMTSKFGFRR